MGETKRDGGNSPRPWRREFRDRSLPVAARIGRQRPALKPGDADSAAATQITVVQNWFEELKKKVPVK